MNLYLEKIAGIPNISKFIGDVSGRTAKMHKQKVENVTDFLANKENLHGLHRKQRVLDKRKNNARVLTGVGAVGTVAATGAGYNHIRNKQMEETARQYAALYKESSILKAVDNGLSKAVSTIGKGVGKVTGFSNTIFGGKLKTYANKNGIGIDSPHYEAFNSASSVKDKANILRQHGTPGPNVEGDLKRLKSQQNYARVGAAGIIGTGVVLHNRKKNDQQNSQYSY